MRADFCVSASLITRLAVRGVVVAVAVVVGGGGGGGGDLCRVVAGRSPRRRLVS